MNAQLIHRRVTRAGFALALVLVALVGISSSAAASTSTAPAGRMIPQTDAAGTVWLCRPGLTNDPCAGNVSTTVVTANNQRTVVHSVTTGSEKFNCFYLYPTASTEMSVNSDLTVQPAEISAAMSQTAPYSDVCDVWAPMYRQITVHALLGGTAGPNAGTIAFASVLSAWKDFLAHDDQGRPIILISHSQGSVMMIKLLQSQVDNDPSLRHKLVVAIIAGGNVTVPDGKEVGLTFHHIPACTKVREAGCVIAYSSFPSVPPADSMFGRAGQGISLNYGQSQTAGVHVVCVNPADISGGTAELSPWFTVAAVQPLPAQASRLRRSARPGSAIPRCTRRPVRAPMGPTGSRSLTMLLREICDPYPPSRSAQPSAITSTTSTCRWPTSSKTCATRRLLTRADRHRPRPLPGLWLTPWQTPKARRTSHTNPPVRGFQGRPAPVALGHPPHRSTQASQVAFPGQAEFRTMTEGQ